MRFADVATIAWRSLEDYKTRTLLMVLAMSVSVAAISIQNPKSKIQNPQ